MFLKYHIDSPSDRFRLSTETRLICTECMSELLSPHMGKFEWMQRPTIKHTAAEVVSSCLLEPFKQMTSVRVQHREFLLCTPVFFQLQATCFVCLQLLSEGLCLLQRSRSSVSLLALKRRECFQEQLPNSIPSSLSTYELNDDHAAAPWYTWLLCWSSLVSCCFAHSPFVFLSLQVLLWSCHQHTHIFSSLSSSFREIGMSLP